MRYDQRKECFGHEFRKYLIETEYGINANPRTLVNPMSNATLERIHQVLINLLQTFNVQQTYIDKNYPWTGILAAAEFPIFSTTNRKKGYSSGQLIFARYTIPPINIGWIGN